jgi:hypothetical protein
MRSFDSVALDGLIESLRRHQNRPFQQSPVFHFFQPLNVFPNGEWELEKKGHQTGP